MVRYCVQCGAKYEGNEKFCMKCGTPLPQIEEPAAVPVSNMPVPEVTENVEETAGEVVQKTVQEAAPKEEYVYETPAAPVSAAPVTPAAPIAPAAPQNIQRPVQNTYRPVQPARPVQPVKTASGTTGYTPYQGPGSQNYGNYTYNAAPGQKTADSNIAESSAKKAPSYLKWILIGAAALLLIVIIICAVSCGKGGAATWEKAVNNAVEAFTKGDTNSLYSMSSGLYKDSSLNSMMKMFGAGDMKTMLSEQYKSEYEDMKEEFDDYFGSSKYKITYKISDYQQEDVAEALGEVMSEFGSMLSIDLKVTDAYTVEVEVTATLGKDTDTEYLEVLVWKESGSWKLVYLE